MAKAKKEALMTLVQSAVKTTIKEAGCQTSGDLVPALNGKVHDIIGQAINRCKTNGRATVRPGDL